MQASSYFKRTIPLGNASTLLIGKSHNVEASVLMKFLIILSDSIRTAMLNDSATVKSSWIELSKVYTFGDSLAPLDFTVHKVNSPWTASGFDADSLPGLSYDASDLSSNRKFTDTLTTFTLSNSIATEWLKESADTTLSSSEGIYFKPSQNAKKVIGYQALSISSSVATLLKIVIEKPGVYTDTLTFFPAQDISVVKGNLPQIPQEDIMVQAGLIANSKIWFDVSRIPGNTLINHAELTFNVDTLETVTGDNYLNSLVAINLSDSTTLAYDTLQSIVLYRNGNQFTGNITAIVQKWIDTGENQGMLIQANNQSRGLELFALKGSSAKDYSLRPRLKIIYTSQK
jgi:hypothetical protein